MQRLAFIAILVSVVNCSPQTSSGGPDLNATHTPHDLAMMSTPPDFANAAMLDLTTVSDLTVVSDMARACVPLMSVCGVKADCCDAKADCQLAPSDSDCCYPKDANCTDGTQCCGYMNCVGGHCAAGQPGDMCAYNGECASGTCNGAPMGTCG